MKPNNGALVIHTAPNLWRYRYEHPHQQKAAKQAGFWLPRTRRTWHERLMHINEQNPRVLKRQLSRYFPYVAIWFTDEQGMGGSLLRKFNVADMRRAHSIFAVASYQPIDYEKLADTFRMTPLTAQEAERISLQIEEFPEHVRTDEIFSLTATLNNPTDKRLTSMMPNPIHLSYHWMDEEGSIIVYDGMRTILDQSLLERMQATYSVQVKAPNRAGVYILRIIPVQEMVRWHESTNMADLIVTVYE